MDSLNITGFPRNRQHFARLLTFGQEVLDICGKLKISPILNASLAVFAYTQNMDMVVNDIDMLIPETDFSRLGDALTQQDISIESKPYHVLRVLRDDLKLDFDSQDYWSQQWGITISGIHRTVIFGDFQIKIISLQNLIRTYQAGAGASQDAMRSADYQHKLQALEHVHHHPE